MIHELLARHLAQIEIKMAQEVRGEAFKEVFDDLRGLYPITDEKVEKLAYKYGCGR